MLPISGLPVEWAVFVLLISSVFVARREVVKLVLGLSLIFRAEKRDVPAIADALFKQSARK